MGFGAAGFGAAGFEGAAFSPRHSATFAGTMGPGDAFTGACAPACAAGGCRRPSDNREEASGVAFGGGARANSQASQGSDSPGCLAGIKNPSPCLSNTGAFGFAAGAFGFGIDVVGGCAGLGKMPFDRFLRAASDASGRYDPSGATT